MSSFLLLDTSPVLRRIMHKVLVSAGRPHVVQAARGFEAFALLAQHPIDVVVVGRQVDGLPGTKFVRRLKQTSRYRHLPVLMVSDRSTPQDIWEVAESGVDSYVLMPFRAQVFLEKVDALLAAPRAEPVPPVAPKQGVTIHRLYQDASLAEDLSATG